LFVFACSDAVKWSLEKTTLVYNTQG